MTQKVTFLHWVPIPFCVSSAPWCLVRSTGSHAFPFSVYLTSWPTEKGQEHLGLACLISAHFPGHKGLVMKTEHHFTARGEGGEDGRGMILSNENTHKSNYWPMKIPIPQMWLTLTP